MLRGWSEAQASPRVVSEGDFHPSLSRENSPKGEGVRGGKRTWSRSVVVGGVCQESAFILSLISF